MKLLSLLACAGGAAGCDAQVDAAHRGTPLATISGTIRNERTLPVGRVEVMTMWATDGDETASAIGGPETTQVSPSFPAGFELALFEPVDPEGLVGPPGSRFALGWVWIVSPGVLGDPTDAPIVYGIDHVHRLLYVEGELPAAPGVAHRIGPGFHLVRVQLDHNGDVTGVEPFPDGLATPIEITLVDDIDTEATDRE